VEQKYPLTFTRAKQRKRKKERLVPPPVHVYFNYQS